MKTLHAFFDKLGPERTAAIEAVSADAASWIRNVVEDRCPQAALCMDPYHVVAWATDALDKVRRQVFQLPVDAALDLLEQWLKWARRCRLGPFVDLAKRITRHRERIAASLRLRLSNGLVESMNTKIRLIMRRAFGFHSPEPLIGLAMLDLRGLCPQLPGRGR